MIKILIDNGHGVNTPGKCSPDKRLREYAYAREIATRVVNELRGMGYNAERVVEEEQDIALHPQRARPWHSIFGTKQYFKD